MIRRLTLVVTCVSAFAAGGPLTAAPLNTLIDQNLAARHGLSRAWYAQVQVDRSRGRVTHMVLREGTLFVQTNRAMVHALDAETGQSLWAAQVGTPGAPDMPVDANGDYVALANGTNLYILNRFDGKLLWQKQLEGMPGAGPAFSSQRVYVPMLDGAVYSYPLKPLAKPVLEIEGEETKKTAATGEKAPAKGGAAAKQPTRPAGPAAKAPARAAASAAADEAAAAAKPAKTATEEPSAKDEQERRASLRLSQETVISLNCRGIGDVVTRPLVTMQTTGEEAVAWATSRGYLYMGRLFEDRFAVAYRLSTGKPMSAEPSYLPRDVNIDGDSGVIYGTSEDGYVYAVRENTGTLLWRFSTNEPIVERSFVIGLRIYVPTQLKGMFCLNAETSEQVWWTPGIRRFIAASRDRLYTIDRIGQMVVLNAQTGARLDSFDLSALPIRMGNDMTDRIYVASPTGLVQCLHEIDLPQPIHHREVLRKQRAKAAEERAARQEAAKAQGTSETPPKAQPDAMPAEKPAPTSKKAAALPAEKPAAASKKAAPAAPKAAQPPADKDNPFNN